MPHAQSRLTIDLNAVKQNYQTLCTKAGTQCQTAAAVKANAYGLGVEKVAPALRDAGCKSFYIATLEEGLQLRQILGNEPRILMLNGLWVKEIKTYVEHDICPVLSSVEEIEAWLDAKPPNVKAAVHIDTGMNRLGIRYDAPKLEKYAQKLIAGQLIDTVLSHFACADEADHPLNAQQIARFEQILPFFPDCRRSFCNSYGIYSQRAAHYDEVKPGMSLYGLNPCPGTDNPMKDVVRLETKILQIHDVQKGETAGYGATYTFEQDSTLATVGLGYADGFHRFFSNSGTLYWQGHPCPIRGRVSMDLVIVDLSGLPEEVALPSPNDWLEVIGPHQSADDLADHIGTIGYEVLTNLGPRHKRHYNF